MTTKPIYERELADLQDLIDLNLQWQDDPVMQDADTVLLSGLIYTAGCYIRELEERLSIQEEMTEILKKDINRMLQKEEKNNERHD